jgi:hypothetical protein
MRVNRSVTRAGSDRRNRIAFPRRATLNRLITGARLSAVTGVPPPASGASTEMFFVTVSPRPARL